MTRAMIAVVFVIGMLGAWWVGQANGAESVIAMVYQEQAEYVRLQAASDQAIAEAMIEAAEWRSRYRWLEEQLDSQQATNDWYRQQLDQKSAEASRFKSLSNFLSGTAY